MKQYEKYKDSGIEWMGKVPEHWEVVAIKYLFNFTTGFTPPTNRDDFYGGDLDWVTIADMNTKYISESKNKITKKAVEFLNKTPIPKGSLMYSFKLSVGKVAFASKDLYTNEAIFSVFPKNGLELRYYYYALQEILIHNANENIYGAKLLNQELILNSLLPSIPLSEQHSIATYLDYTVGKIDSIISEKETLIDKLQEKRKALINEVVTKGLNPNVPMRDSGVEWLGEVPEHWEVSKLKNIASLINGYAFKSEMLSEFGVPVIRIGDIKSEVSIETSKRISENELYNNSIAKKNDILVAMTGATIGKSAIYLSEQLAYINQRVCAIRILNTATQSLIKYILQTDFFKEFIRLECNGSAQENISSLQLSNLEILRPPLSEQTAIVTYIESKTTKIDAAVNELKSQIEKLKEYKTSVISEAVTGKIDVRDWQMPN